MFCFYLILSICWFVFMTWLSHQNGERTSATSRELACRLEALLAFLPHGPQEEERLNSALRKTAHCVVFAVLTLLTAMTLWTAPFAVPGPAYLLWLGILLGWAWGDERTKRMIPGRHFSWYDVGLNALGVALGALTLYMLYLRRP